MPFDFVLGGLPCRWQGHVPDAAASARAWLGGAIAGKAADSLQRDARGRPRLPAGSGDISWSHSGGRLLMAYVPSGIVGVDLECSSRRVNALRIARRYFAASELRALQALEGEVRTLAFLHLWCAKEAVLKAHGHGIAFGLARVTFELAGDQMRMLHCDPALGNVTDWRLHTLTPEPGYLAVLAHSDGILRA